MVSQVKSENVPDSIYCKPSQGAICGVTLDECCIDEIGSKTPIREWSANLQFSSGTKIKFKIDSGAQANIIPLEILPDDTFLESSNVNLTAFGGSKLMPKWTVNMPVTCNGRTVKAKFFVVEFDCNPLLGIQIIFLQIFLI